MLFQPQSIKNVNKAIGMVVLGVINMEVKVPSYQQTSRVFSQRALKKPRKLLIEECIRAFIWWIVNTQDSDIFDAFKKDIHKLKRLKVITNFGVNVKGLFEQRTFSSTKVALPYRGTCKKQ